MDSSDSEIFGTPQNADSNALVNVQSTLRRHIASLMINFNVVKEPTSKRYKTPDELPWHETSLVDKLDPDDQ